MCQLKNKLSVCFLTMLVALFSSCSGSDYLNAIPSGSIALVSLDMQKMAGDSAVADKAGILKSVLHVDDVLECGIDVSEKVFLFEAADGNLGLCAKVADKGDLEDWLNKLSRQGICQKVSERKDCHFTVLNGSWLVGFSGKALMVMGPVVPEAQAELQRKMIKYLGAGEEAGIKGTPMFDKLDSISASTPMAMVAQAQALPEMFVAPFVLGAPRGSDASQVVIAAGMTIEKGMLHIKGETFSFDKDVNAALRQAAKVYRPIKGSYVKAMPDDALAGIFMNVDGKGFLPLLQGNKSLQTLLMGMNAAVDMDNIIRSVDGDMAIIVPSFSDGNVRLMMSAQVAHASWLADVDYWKQSCPKGGKIVNWGKNAYCYTNGKTAFYFGVTDDSQFFCGSDQLLAEASIKPSSHPVDRLLQQAVTGQKLAMVVNLSKVGGVDDSMAAIIGLLTPIFGNINSIVYTVR